MRKLVCSASIAAIVTVLASASAQAYQVYPGCTVPPAAPAATAQVWYVDPVNGKTPAAGGNGSQAAPWNSIQGVLSGLWDNNIVVPGYTRPLLSSVPYNHQGLHTADNLGNPPVHPGDTIMLMTGNYGNVAIGTNGVSTANSDWVTVQAAPGALPVFSGLTMSGTNKWIFNGVKITGVVPTVRGPFPPALLAVSDQGAAIPTTDIIFNGMQLSTVDDASAWTKAQWQTSGRNGFTATATAGNGTNGQPNLTCISMTNSKIKNVRWGITMVQNNSLFANNDLGYFGDDGIDYAANNIAITNNYLHDNFDVGDSNHEDAMQGQNGPTGGRPLNFYSNILIDRNVVVRQTDPALPFPTYLQGIDAFDEDWTNLTITNNVIVTSSCYAVAVSSIHNSLIAGNVGLDDGKVVTAGCTPGIGGGQQTHEGPPSTNSRFSNNIANSYTIGGPGAVGVTYDHNLAVNGGFVHYINGAWVFGSPVGTDANGNVTMAKGTFTYPD
jgi:hypothetical protein